MPNKNPPARDDGDGYQGWANYETWAIQLWFGNEEPLYRHWTKAAKVVAKEHESRRAAGIELGRAMRDFVEEDLERNKAMDKLPGYAKDLLNAALSEVEWDEIGEAWLEDFEFAEDEDDDRDADSTEGK